VKRLAIAAVVVAVAACNGDLDPPWQLDHDRIVAVRATPPTVEPGGTAIIDGLIAHAGGMTEQRGPDIVIVARPESLASAVSFDGKDWRVTAPAEAQLVAARTELKLPADAPVPVTIGVSYANNTLLATKTVVFGPRAENPTLDAVMIDGAPAPDTMISVGSLVDVRLSVTKPEKGDVNWLTSCGTMHDFDLPEAYLRVEKEDPTTGELAVVVRDGVGGVVWRVWPIAAHE
jgi:hypothetical protein